MKNIDLIKAFQDGATTGKSHTDNLYIKGDNLINYSTVLATRVNGGIVMNTHKYSVTTSKIQTYIKRYCQVVDTYCE